MILILLILLRILPNMVHLILEPSPLYVYDEGKILIFYDGEHCRIVE